MSLEEVEAFLIKKALARDGGNVSRAAERARAVAQRASTAASSAMGSETPYTLRDAMMVSTAPPGIARIGPPDRMTRRLSHEQRVLLLAPGAARSRGRGRAGPAVGRAPQLPHPLDTRRDGDAAGARVRGVARAAVVRPLQTLSNLLAALREEDYSFRARCRAGPTPWARRCAR